MTPTKTPSSRPAAGKPAAGPDGAEPGEGPRSRLSKATVVEQALAVGDAEGLDGLTIRRLAQELGVTPMALYWHFRSKEELLGGLAERIWGEIDTNINAAAPWPDQFRGLLESLVRVLRAHPCASQLLLQGQKQSPAALRAIEVTLDVLGRAGLDERYATEVARSTLWTGLMLAMSEPGLDLPQDAAERAEALRRNQVRLAMLPPDQFPCVVRSAVQMTSCDDPDFHYRLGVDLFVAGVEAIAARVTGAQDEKGEAGTHD